MPDDRKARVAHYRHGGGGREPLAAPDEGGSHTHYTPSRQHGLGSLTSRRPPSYAELFRQTPTGPRPTEPAP